MKKETAKLLLGIMLKHSKEQNELLKSIVDMEDAEELRKVKSIVGQTMGSMYLDAIHPILTEHPDLTPPEVRGPVDGSAPKR